VKKWTGATSRAANERGRGEGGKMRKERKGLEGREQRLQKDGAKTTIPEGSRKDGKAKHEPAKRSARAEGGQRKPSGDQRYIREGRRKAKSNRNTKEAVRERTIKGASPRSETRQAGTKLRRKTKKVNVSNPKNACQPS